MDERLPRRFRELPEKSGNVVCSPIVPFFLSHRLCRWVADFFSNNFLLVNPYPVV
jgi:hypothetical protein